MKNIAFAPCVVFACFAAVAGLSPTLTKAASQSQKTPSQPHKPATQSQGKSSTHVSSAVPRPGTATVPEDYVIGREDVLEINVWHEPDLSTKTVVRPDGKIGIRLLNEVQASGLTTNELKQHIQEGLAQFVADPVVSVIVTEVRSQMVHIVGGVARPGAYPLAAPLTVVELLARAGGLVDFAKKDSIVIIRSEAGTARRLSFNYKEFADGNNLQQNIILRSGDVIVVP
jgi:polysaccharide biosynthesis/export protein